MTYEIFKTKMLVISMGTRSEEFNVLKNPIFRSICQDKNKLVLNSEKVVDESGVLKLV